MKIAILLMQTAVVLGQLAACAKHRLQACTHNATNSPKRKKNILIRHSLVGVEFDGELEIERYSMGSIASREAEFWFEELVSYARQFCAHPFFPN